MGKDEDFQLQLEVALAECARLRAQNSRLKALLGLAETEAVSPAESLPHEQEVLEIVASQQQNLFTITNHSSTEEKIALFRSLFRGREDVYAVRWEGKNGSFGYSPACRNEWNKVFCRKPKIKCSQCDSRELLPLTDQVILNHLTGKHIVGLYPLLSDETCQILAVDFDKASWRDDAVAFLQTCKEMGVPAALERSRSGNGGHVWIFFDRLVEASLARKLGCAVLTRTMECHRHVGLDSYDRFFPNQDTMPKGGFGNLIALPLQRGPRDKRNSLFLDPDLQPYPDQWAFLSSLQKMKAKEAEAKVQEVSRTGGVMGGIRMSLTDSDGDQDPWTLPPSKRRLEERVVGLLPEKIKIVSGNLLYIERAGLPPVLLNRLTRLTAFLELPPKSIGQIGGGKVKPTGIVDIAVIQSLYRKGEVKDIVAEYGQVIVDECHHLSAFSFEKVLRQVKARNVIGLTATPIRKDGHHPIIMMECGPIRFRTNTREQADARPFDHVVIPRNTRFYIPFEEKEFSIQDIYTAMATDSRRNDLIIEDILKAVEAGRSPLLLTERTEHLECFANRLAGAVKNVIVLRGGMGARQRRAIAEQIAAIPDGEERVLIATGRYIGEGFDDARLDTLFLTMPISWRGTLQQYAGRLHRLHDSKRVVQVYDYIDVEVPVLVRMFEKRLKGYKAIGYSIQRD